MSPSDDPRQNPRTEQTTPGDAATAETPPSNQASPAAPPGFFARQYPAEEGGMATAMYCPSCGGEIHGSYLPVFTCPHCEIFIFRDDRGAVTMYEQKQTCPECGHSFAVMIDEIPTEFRRVSRDLERVVEGAVLGLDRIAKELFS